MTNSPRPEEVCTAGLGRDRDHAGLDITVASRDGTDEDLLLLDGLLVDAEEARDADAVHVVGHLLASDHLGC